MEYLDCVGHTRLGVFRKRASPPITASSPRKRKLSQVRASLPLDHEEYEKLHTRWTCGTRCRAASPNRRKRRLRYWTAGKATWTFVGSLIYSEFTCATRREDEIIRRIIVETE